MHFRSVLLLVCPVVVGEATENVFNQFPKRRRLQLLIRNRPKAARRPVCQLHARATTTEIVAYPLL